MLLYKGWEECKRNDMKYRTYPLRQAGQLIFKVGTKAILQLLLSPAAWKKIILDLKDQFDLSFILLGSFVIWFRQGGPAGRGDTRLPSDVLCTKCVPTLPKPESGLLLFLPGCFTGAVLTCTFDISTNWSCETENLKIPNQSFPDPRG